MTLFRRRAQHTVRRYYTQAELKRAEWLMVRSSALFAIGASLLITYAFFGDEMFAVFGGN